MLIPSSVWLLLGSLALAQKPPAIPADLIHEADIEYSNVGQRVAMDVVRPRVVSATPRPAVLLIHGGGFPMGRPTLRSPTRSPSMRPRYFRCFWAGSW